MKFDTILFDADGTLFDFAKSEKEAVSDAMRTFGIEPTDEKVSDYSRINDMLWKMLERGEIEKNVLLYRRFEIFCEKYGYERDPVRFAETYMQNLSQKVYLFPGAAELCRSLSHLCKLYIVTNGVEFIQKGRFGKCKIRDCFSGLFISGEIGYEKPNIKFFEYVAEKIENFDKNITLIVGDSLTADIAGGIAFGIGTCWYNPHSKPLPDGIKVDCIAENYDRIYNFICGR